MGNSKSIQIFDMNMGGDELKKKEFINSVGTFGNFGIVSMGFYADGKSGDGKTLFFLDENLMQIKKIE